MDEYEKLRGVCAHLSKNARLVVGPQLYIHLPLMSTIKLMSAANRITTGAIWAVCSPTLCAHLAAQEVGVRVRTKGQALELQIGILPARHLMIVHISAAAAQRRLKGGVKPARLLPIHAQPVYVTLVKASVKISAFQCTDDSAHRTLQQGNKIHNQEK